MNTPHTPKGDPVARAVAAYYRDGGGLDQPQPANTSGIVTHAGKRYVVLRNRSNVLAVYRIRTDGVLKRLIRWPVEIER